MQFQGNGCAQDFSENLNLTQSHATPWSQEHIQNATLVGDAKVYVCQCKYSCFQAENWECTKTSSLYSSLLFSILLLCTLINGYKTTKCWFFYSRNSCYLRGMFISILTACCCNELWISSSPPNRGKPLLSCEQDYVSPDQKCEALPSKNAKLHQELIKTHAHHSPSIQQ